MHLRIIVKKSNNGRNSKVKEQMKTIKVLLKELMLFRPHRNTEMIYFCFSQAQIFPWLRLFLHKDIVIYSVGG